MILVKLYGVINIIQALNWVSYLYENFSQLLGEQDCFADLKWEKWVLERLDNRIYFAQLIRGKTFNFNPVIVTWNYINAFMFKASIWINKGNCYLFVFDFWWNVNQCDNVARSRLYSISYKSWTPLPQKKVTNSNACSLLPTSSYFYSAYLLARGSNSTSSYLFLQMTCFEGYHFYSWKIFGKLYNLFPAISFSDLWLVKFEFQMNNKYFLNIIISHTL